MATGGFEYRDQLTHNAFKFTNGRRQLFDELTAELMAQDYQRRLEQMLSQPLDPAVAAFIGLVGAAEEPSGLDALASIAAHAQQPDLPI